MTDHSIPAASTPPPRSVADSCDRLPLQLVTVPARLQFNTRGRFTNAQRLEGHTNSSPVTEHHPYRMHNNALNTDIGP